MTSLLRIGVSRRPSISLSFSFAALLYFVFSPAAGLIPALADETAPAAEGEPGSSSSKVVWKNIEPGFDFARYELGAETFVIHPEVYLLKFDPNRFTFHAVIADGSRDDSGRFPGADIRTLTKKIGGVAGVNANFFDESGSPLGLLIENSTAFQKLHRGGKVMTGIFSVKDFLPRISQRDSFNQTGLTTAIQAGPRLIENGAVIRISPADDSSRRSGVAVTQSNEVIVYATVLRFPGASLLEIQHMLIDPALKVKDALNLDGGGSSQMFVESYPSLKGETSISGGDLIPVGLVVKRRGANE